MKMFYRLIFYVAIPLFVVICVGLFFLYGPTHLPITIDRQEYDVLLTPDDVEEGFRLYFLYQYPNTNYIVAKFIRQMRYESLVMQDSVIQTEKIFFIDLDKQKRVMTLELEYSIRDNISNKWFYSMNRLTSSHMLRMDDEIVHIFHYLKGSGLAQSMTGKSPWMTKIGNYINSGESVVYSVVSTGEFLDLQFSKLITPIFGTDTFFAVQFNGKTSELNTLSQSNVHSENVWDTVTHFSDPVYLGHNKYFVRFSYEKGPRLLVDANPSTHKSITIDDRIPNVDKIYPLTAGRFEQPAMLLFMIRGYGGHLVYEVDSRHEIDDAKFDPDHAVYRHLRKPPFAAMNQNQVLVFQDNDINLEHEVLKNSGRMYYSLREENEDGSSGRFSLILQDIDVPDEIEMISKYPFDDEHFLLYGKNALWTMKWDGTEFRKLFPNVNGAK